MTQSGWVAERLREAVPGLSVELVEIRTSGDVIKDVPLGPALGQSFFTKEIEEALLAERVDVAVHSCKDLATTGHDALVIAAIPEREDPRDVLVSPHGRLADLPEGARVGTSSMRRKGFLRVARPDLVLTDQRGNVPTRLRATEEGRVDAVVLAAAGLARLGLLERATDVLDPALMLPAAAQGALAVQVRVADEETRRIVAVLDHATTRAAVEAERACLHRLEAGCQAPVGVLGEMVAGVASRTLRVRAAVVTPEGLLDAEREGAPGASEDLGRSAAEDLLERLGLRSLRGVDWAGPPPRAERSTP